MASERSSISSIRNQENNRNVTTSAAGCCLPCCYRCPGDAGSPGDHAEDGEDGLVQDPALLPRPFPGPRGRLLPDVNGPHRLLHLATKCANFFRKTQVNSVLISLNVSLFTYLSINNNPLMFSCRTIDPDAYLQLQSKYGDKIPLNLYYNKGL